MNVVVGGAAALKELMSWKVDVSLVVGVVGLANLAKIARRTHFERILRRMGGPHYNRFFLGILNLFLEL